MTLVELLVAFMVFLMMIGALVTLTTRSLSTWMQGETRKEVYDRAQLVLDVVARDTPGLKSAPRATSTATAVNRICLSECGRRPAALPTESRL